MTRIDLFISETNQYFTDRPRVKNYTIGLSNWSVVSVNNIMKLTIASVNLPSITSTTVVVVVKADDAQSEIERKYFLFP